jgi:glutaminyl-tRNA synthetase
MAPNEVWTKVVEPDREATLVSMGLDPKAAATACQSTKVYDLLVAALTTAAIQPPLVTDVARRAASLIYTTITRFGDKKMAAKARAVPDHAKEALYAAIGDGRISSTVNLDPALGYLFDLYGSGTDGASADAVFDLVAFETAAGVGVVVTKEQIKAAVDGAIEANKPLIIENRYRFNSGLLLRSIMTECKFGEGKLIRDILDMRLVALLGPKTEADLVKPAKQKKAKPVADTASTNGNAAPGAPVVTPEASEAGAPEDDPFAGIPAAFHARDVASAENTPELLAKRSAATDGKIVCRFPPEPNGYLHVGHAKAMFVDFGFAQKTGGYTILRFDDTNPVAEKTEYIDSILDIVSWLGHTPARITYSSDYFEELYDLAVELIRRDKAYVCHQTGEDIRKGREFMVDSPYRGRPVEESLALFADMRKGVYAEGEAILRMKIDMKAVNPVMRDPIAYRVLHSPHARTGDTWCIYPSYDYTHCIVDSLEWITHSLCTLEFEIRRDSYYWLLEALDLYRPFVWEFARLSLEYTMMSKRKLKELVERGIVSGWDDPRMPTLSGMRRRGYPATAINRFCAAIGASRASNMIGLHVLEHWVRDELNQTSPRAFAVLRPLRVVITNFRGEESLIASNHPKDESLGTRELLLTDTVYIEATDFRPVDEKSYYGLAPGKTAMLRYAFPVTVNEVVMKDNDSDEVAELRVTMDYEKSVKPKGVLHWVNQTAPRAEIRMLSTLFKNPDPASLDKSEWLEDVNSDSVHIISDALVEHSVCKAEVRSSFQFERTGYFTVDDDTTPDRTVFNLVVSLRDSR